jgi:hypothetical protein
VPTAGLLDLIYGITFVIGNKAAMANATAQMGFSILLKEKGTCVTSDTIPVRLLHRLAKITTKTFA